MNERERIAERIKKNTKRAAEANARIVPDIPGTVRVDGPRRQYRVTVDAANGRLIYTEI